jgi:hypothetical protein
MMWWLKKICSCREHIFSDHSSFLKRSVRRPFFVRSGRCPSSSGRVPRGTRSCICTCFVRTWNFTIACAIAFSDRVHDRTNDLFDRSRVRTPGLARDRFSWVQGSNPCPCSTIFSWVQGSIPWPWSPIFRPGVSLAYVTRPHEWSNRWHRRTKKTLIRGKKNVSAWVVAFAVWGSRKVSTCD